MSTANKIISAISTTKTSCMLYLDMAAELSKIDRKNHHQVTEKGVPLVYDLQLTITSPLVTDKAFDPSSVLTVPALLASGTVFAASPNWQTRNAVRMAHFTREDLRKEAGVKKGSIGRYAKTLRCNLDQDMFNVVYDPTATLTGASNPQRIYGMKDVYTDSVSTVQKQSGVPWVGGVWDYTQLAQVKSGDADTADPFYLNVCESHSAAAPGPYTYIGLLQAYNQRRQTTLDDATLTSGGDAQFVNKASPFFRIPEQDVSEDKYVEITLDEQDNPPYDREIGVGLSASADSKEAQGIEFFQLTEFQSSISMRIQAPLGLVQLDLQDLIGGTNPAEDFRQHLMFEIECLGTYEL